ncbi:hypothetical protein DBR06_SOUSAS25710020, partial [Sousa chinensis]
QPGGQPGKTKARPS